MDNESVKVCDIEITELGTMALKWEAVDAILEEYLTHVNAILSEALISGEAHDALQLLCDEVALIKKYSSGLGNTTSKLANSFLSTIEDIDLNLYNKV